MQRTNKGFILVALLIVLVLAGLSLLAYRVYTHQRAASPVQNPGGARPKSAESHKRVVAVGDIVCDPTDTHADGSDPNYCQDKKVAQQIATIHPDALLLLGDLQYNDGSTEKFANTFSKNWQRFKSISYPAPGNHEYVTDNALGYYQFFSDTPVDSSKGFYQFKLGAWQIFSLNSNCGEIGGCGQNTAQITWLEKELESNNTTCELAFWHHPRFTSGKYSDDTTSSSRSDAMWSNLQQHKTDVVLSGHDHLYERFQKQTALGNSSETGIRQFTVGTGGKSHYEHKSIARNSQKIIDDQFGVLIIDLYLSHYSWQFESISGKILDSGTENCH